MELSTPRAPRVTPELHRLGLALVLAGLLVAQVLLLHPSAPATLAAAILRVTSAIAATLPLITVGRRPLPSLAAMCLGAASLELGGLSSPVLWVALVVAVYVVANLFGLRPGLAAAAAAALALALPGARGLTPVGMAASLLTMSAMTVAAVAFGEANRMRHARMVEAELRAEQADVAREAQAALAVEEERLRIARELHDVTAHSLSVVSIQSELARKALRSDPATAEAALDAIGDTSRQALSELRAMLGQLRAASEPEARVPAPSLAQLGDLVRRLEDAGVTVRLTAGPMPAALPPFVDATAFRIAQEAVTNVVRHALASEVAIELTSRDGELRLAVTDDGRGGAAAAAAEGHGIRGMRERAAAAGGSLEAGPLPTGGWRVEARLPVPDTDGGSRT